jgi:hypothetical protein
MIKSETCQPVFFLARATYLAPRRIPYRVGRRTVCGAAYTLAQSILTNQRFEAPCTGTLAIWKRLVAPRLPREQYTDR